MSIESPLFTQTVFHKVRAISGEEHEPSTENESDSSDDLNNQVDEFEEFSSNNKVPALIIAGTQRVENCEEINSALWKAAQQGKAELCEDLLSNSFYGLYRADINYKGPEDWTPLHIAAYSGHLHVCSLLLSYKSAIPDSLSSTLKTPLHLACSQGHLDISHLLVKKGADIHQQDQNGNTPIHLAALNGQELVVSWLLLQKPDLNLYNEDGQTPEDCSSTGCKKLFLQYKELQDLLSVDKGSSRKSARFSFPIIPRTKKTRKLSACNDIFLN
jgi:hypothetical protein